MSRRSRSAPTIGRRPTLRPHEACQRRRRKTTDLQPRRSDRHLERRTRSRRSEEPLRSVSFRRPCATVCPDRGRVIGSEERPPLRSRSPESEIVCPTALERQMGRTRSSTERPERSTPDTPPRRTRSASVGCWRASGTAGNRPERSATNPDAFGCSRVSPRARARVGQRGACGDPELAPSTVLGVT